MRGRVPVGLLALGLALAGAGGCGYTLGGNLPGHLKTVAVPVFVNKSLKPDVSGPITVAVAQAFALDGRLRVVPLSEADTILEGEIVAYRLELVGFDAQANVQVYQVVVTLNVRFRDVRAGGMLWQQDGMQEVADFRAPGAVAATFAREDAAVAQVAVELGRAIVARAVDRF